MAYGFEFPLVGLISNFFNVQDTCDVSGNFAKRFSRAALAGQHRRIVHIVHDPGGVDSYHPKELKSNESRQGAVELQSQFSGISNYVL